MKNALLAAAPVLFSIFTSVPVFAQDLATSCNKAMESIEGEYDGAVTDMRKQLGARVRQHAAILEKAQDKLEESPNMGTEALKALISNEVEALNTRKGDSEDWTTTFAFTENDNRVRLCALHSYEGADTQNFGCSELDFRTGRIRGRTVPGAVRVAGEGAANPLIGFTFQAYTIRRMKEEHPHCVSGMAAARRTHQHSRTPASSK